MKGGLEWHRALQVLPSPGTVARHVEDKSAQWERAQPGARNVLLAELACLALPLPCLAQEACRQELHC